MRVHVVAIAVAGVVVEIALPAHDWAEAVHQRYPSFLIDATPTWWVGVRCDPEVAFETAGWASHEGTVTRFHVSWYRGEIDLARHTAWVTAPSPERLASALERTLTYILMQALPRDHDALLLHACGVDLEGRGHAFFGPSGAGKTTVARLAQGHGEVLCDENVVLSLADGGVRLVSTPFWGASTPSEMVHRVNRSVPLSRLLLLAHAPAFDLRLMTPGQAVAALLSTQKVATERVESAHAWLGVAARIVERVPVSTLSFPPSTELWSFLLRHEDN